jgi:23S rRNA pseudouridine955/2504/2580 synthase
MKGLGKDSVTWLEADEGSAGQRVDNMLARVLKGVPRPHVYQLLRTGQVRVNSRRVDATYRLKPGDRIRVPPVRIGRADAAPGRPPRGDLESAILHEDEHIIALDKPAGLAVHGGSGVSRGVIEEMRLARPGSRFLELVHRLDRDTSGVLLIAKKRAALVKLHTEIREGNLLKVYTLLVRGRYEVSEREVSVPLAKYVLAGGDRRVRAEAGGQSARTVFTTLRCLGGFSLIEARLLTGRTHQIRVHAVHTGHPIVGDDKYGDFELNKQIAKRGLKRMFLHAARVEFTHPGTGERIRLAAPLPAELDGILTALDAERHCDA